MSAQDSPTPTQARRERRDDGRRLHRREMRRQAWVPFWLTLLVILGVLAISALLYGDTGRTQVAAIADWMVTVCLLVPLLICLPIIFVVVAVGVWGINWLHDTTQSPLERLENVTAMMAERVEKLSDKANERVIRQSERLAPWVRFFSIFETGTPTESDTPSVRNVATPSNVEASKTSETDGETESHDTNGTNRRS